MKIGGSQGLVLATVLSPVLFAGVPPTNIAPQAPSQQIVTAQEQPDPGRGIALNPGRQGPNVASGIGRILNVQETSSDNLDGFVLVGAGRQGPNVASGIGRILVIQEPPPSGSAILGAGRQGPNVAVGIGRILNTQELPDTPSGTFLRSHYIITVALGVAPERRALVTLQESPYHPGSILGAGKQGPDVASGIGRIILGQEPPQLGSGILGAGKQGPNVASGIGRLLNVQEQPYHPVSLLQGSFFIPPQVGVRPVWRAVITLQEKPADGSVYAFAGKQGPNVASGIQRIVLGQEQPPQAPSLVKASFTPPPIVTIPAGVRGFILRQEIPFHPSGLLFVPANFVAAPVIPPVNPPPVTTKRLKMYTGSLGAVSNEEDWIVSYTAVDDVGAPFLFTGAAMTVYVCDPDLPKTPILSGSVADGTIVISPDGFTVSWTFPKASMEKLSANQYAVYHRMLLNSVNTQIFAGASISVNEGGPTG